ncbi:MAG TPA: class I SAM-dependent methyltransferase [Spirochaetia bacterium]|nr:class I SAM-dependent methyltransferase [Spirochaetia bacterium]
MKKRKKHLWKWARRNEITCFRLYNRDIPEVPLVIDYYEGYLHIAEYERPAPHTDEEHDVWRSRMLASAAHALTVPEERVFFKYREKQAGHSQYEKLAGDTVTLQVHEAGLQFRVNLSDYVDTGLFLDHRLTRGMVRDAAAGGHMLNLYSYTGSFSVYAAAGGAKSTVSVDLSQHYTTWAQENMRLNGFTGADHRFVREDVQAFLAAAIRRGDRFDLIVIDPPTFSNSKKMEGVLDIQRDHAELINSCARVLSSEGMILFSSNFKKLKFESDKIEAEKIADITQLTIPEDFTGKRPHRAWLISRPRRERKGATHARQ